MPHNVVIVESPAKAKTINKYMGGEYTVLASYGHVRDLPSKNGSVKPEDDFSMVWEVNPKGKKQIKEIEAALKGADALLLATDPDREGEAISWHLKEILQKNKALTGKKVERIVFHEITPSAIQRALATPRGIDISLVDAYLARRALDYLVGFSVSPILWRKLPGSRSAGRVQSVALRLIAQRENEIEVFEPQEYWSLHVLLESAAKQPFEARLTEVGGKKVEKFQWQSKAEAEAILSKVKGYGHYTVDRVEKKQQNRNPSPPFTTSTMQQEAIRKLGFSASKAMRVAQGLYEGVRVGKQNLGVITYMRTDSVTMAGEAVAAVRQLIGQKWDKNYLPDVPRAYKSKAKNAQEAHEAIRPTDFSLTPEKAAAYLDKDQLRLYSLIWKRAVASQMVPAVFEQVRATLVPHDKAVSLTANGSTLVFDGFLTLYQEGQDDAEDEEGRLPPLNQGDRAKKLEDRADQHFTQPPPRYTEASLVKKLEELGIGRPSTYASIIQVLIDRNYVVLEKKRFIPEGRGRVVTSFLENYFSQYVQYSFTADLEDKLDDIAAGDMPWKKLLSAFWQRLNADVKEAEKLKISDVLDVLTDALAPFLWPGDPKAAQERKCPKCASGKLSLKVGRFGAFIGCSDYPDCNFTRKLSDSQEAVDTDETDQGASQDPEPWPKLLGQTEEGCEVTVRKGPYGFYVQLGEGAAKKKPKRTGIPRGHNPASFTLQQALALLSLPREVATDPETKAPVLLGIGRFGPYLKVENTFYSVPKEEDILTMGANRALVILDEKRKVKAKEEGKDGNKATKKAPPKKKVAVKKSATKAAPKQSPKRAPKKAAVGKGEGK